MLNFEIAEELKKIREEFERRISNLESMYNVSKFYKVIPTILDKINCDYLELDINEVNQNNSKYIVQIVPQTNKIIVQRQEISSYEM